MEALRIDARLERAIRLPGAPLALDALLAAQVAMRDGILPAQTEAELVPIEIPVKRSECGRYHLATVGLYDVESRRLAHVYRRFPVEHAQAMGRDIGRVLITAGPAKSYRIPVEELTLVDDRMTWFAVGDRAEIEALLTGVTHLGKKRSVGAGRVSKWTVEPCVWPGLVADGLPLRALPIETSGIDPDRARLAMARLTYPYWAWADRVECWVP